jgi:diketogulonate reductase-like aldo/keto reductase
LRYVRACEYGSGAAEKLVGEAIRGRRKEVFLVSNVLPTRGHVMENYAALKLTSAEDLGELDRAFPPPTQKVRSR